jgi:hypothetical protein
MILPETGRGTATRSGGGGNPDVVQVHNGRSSSMTWAPSTMLRMVPLPVPGRSQAGAGL